MVYLSQQEYELALEYFQKANKLALADPALVEAIERYKAKRKPKQ